MIGGDFDAGGEGAIGIDGELDRGLATAGAQAAELDEQALFEQFIDDIGNGLGSELGAAGDLGGARDWTRWRRADEGLSCCGRSNSSPPLHPR
jgi:hypothetical protein